MLEQVVILIMIVTWIEGYLCTMRFVSITGGYRDAYDVAYQMKLNKKSYYLGVAMFKVTTFFLWPIVFMLRATVAMWRQ